MAYGARHSVSKRAFASVLCPLRSYLEREAHFRSQWKMINSENNETRVLIYIDDDAHASVILTVFGEILKSLAFEVRYSAKVGY